jgi:hypothetical protein
MDSRDIEQRVDRALKALPAPRAPHTLLPRVMAAVAHTGRAPWYSRAWLTWPRAAQAASLFVLVAIGLAMWWQMPVVSAWASNAAAIGEPLTRGVSVALDWAATGVAVGRAIWLVAKPFVVYFLLIAVMTSLMAAAFWTVVNRLALGGASLQ